MPADTISTDSAFEDAPAATYVYRQSNLPMFYLITGTGRCGTMLLARLLSESENSVCEHEECFRHQSLIEYGSQASHDGFEDDLSQRLVPKIESVRDQGHLYGVSSGHAWPAIGLIRERFGDRVRFVLMIREPVEFARSALARGFFDPDHPHSCEQITPRPTDPITERWSQAEPLEKCLWYWQLVNQTVLAEFYSMPRSLWRVVTMESLNTTTVLDLCRFLGIHGLSEGQAHDALSHPTNISPREDGSGLTNPFSRRVTLPPQSLWSAEQIQLLNKYTDPLREKLYGSGAISNPTFADAANT